MPEKLMNGPIDLLAILAIVGTVLNLIALMKGVAVRRLAGKTLVDLGQSNIGRVWELAVVIIFLLPVGLIFAQPAPKEVPTPKFGEQRFTPEEVRSRQIKADLLTRGLPHGLFIVSILAAHVMGVRPGRCEFAEKGLIYGGWQLRTWDLLTSFSWIEGPPTRLTMRFDESSRQAVVPPEHTAAIDQLLRQHIAGEDSLQTVG